MIIGIAGPAGSGKNTTADIIQALLPRTAVQQLAFADPMRAMLNASGIFDDVFSPFELNKQKVHPRWGVSVRQAMQALGTAWGRNLIHETLWRDLTLDKCVDPSMLYIITDVRFLNEAEEIQEHGGFILRVKTPDEPTSWWKNLWRLVKSPSWRRHRSELEGLRIDPDWVIENAQTGVSEYAREVSKMLRHQTFLADQQILPELPNRGH